MREQDWGYFGSQQKVVCANSKGGVQERQQLGEEVWGQFDDQPAAAADPNQAITAPQRC